MTQVSFNGGQTFLDPLSPFSQPDLDLYLSRTRIWQKLVSQMDSELRQKTLSLLQFPTPYLTLPQQRLQFLSTYLILSTDPLVITVTLYDLGILSSPQDGEFLPEPTDKDLYLYGITREIWETGREPARGPQLHPDSWYEERGQIPPPRHARDMAELEEQFEWHNHYEREIEEMGRKEDFESNDKSDTKNSSPNPKPK